MKNQKISSLSDNMKKIIVTGQGCKDDCSGTEIDMANGKYIAVAAVVCYGYECPRKPVRPAHITELF